MVVAGFVEGSTVRLERGAERTGIDDCPSKEGTGRPVPEGIGFLAAKVKGTPDILLLLSVVLVTRDEASIRLTGTLVTLPSIASTAPLTTPKGRFLRIGPSPFPSPCTSISSSCTDANPVWSLTPPLTIRVASPRGALLVFATAAAPFCLSFPESFSCDPCVPMDNDRLILELG